MLKNADIIIAIVILGLCGFLYRLIMDFPPPLLRNTPGPAYFPKLVVIGLASLSLILLVKEISGRSQYLSALKWNKHVLIAMGVAMGYVLLVPFAGYFLATFLFLICWIKVLENRGWLSVIAASVTFLVLVYAFFYKTLRVALPLGHFLESWVR